MKTENGYIYGASKKIIIDMLLSIDDGASVGMAGYDVGYLEYRGIGELEALYMALTGENCFN